MQNEAMKQEDIEALAREMAMAKGVNTEADPDAFCEEWDAKSPSIGLMWRRHWPNLIAIFDYPRQIRRVAEQRNPQIRRETETLSQRHGGI